MMKSFFFTLCVCFYTVSFSQSVFNESFDNNDRHWDLLNEFGNETSVSDGFLNWKRNAEKSDVMVQYLNRLDEKNDWSIRTTITSRKLGSEYGVLWGGKDKSNAYYFTIKGNKYRVFRAKEGKILTSTEYKTNFKIRLDNNEITIAKKAGMINYYINGDKIYAEPYRGIDGKYVGFILFGSSSIAIDDFEATGKVLPLNLIEGVYFPEKPQKLPNTINSQYDEMNPVISASGEKLYFSRKEHPSNVGGPTDVEDAYFSNLTNDSWSLAENMGAPINNHGPNAVHAVTPDGNTLLLMNLYEPDGKQKGQGISVSSRTKGGWSIPEQFKIRQYYNKSGFNEFFLSNTKKVLILAIEMNDVMGGRDLYVSFNEGNDIWSEPKNMGVTINSPGIELSPFLASDGVTLYFSSNGHPGYGQNDVFMSKRLDDTWLNWSTPKNMGEPINGLGKDSYYSVPASGEYAYFVSTDKTLKTTDIFRVKLPEKVKPQPVVIIRGRVLNEKTKEPIGTRITYRDLESNDEAGVAHSDPETGEYEIVLPLEKAYSFFAEKEGFYSVRDNIDLNGVKNYEVIERDLYLAPIEEGESILLKNVLFKQGTPFLLASSYPELDKLAEMMKENATMEIELFGHTDNVGNEDELIKLSEDRVTAVRNYLVQRKGIHPPRISGKGYGGSQPRFDNTYAQTRKLNRRVEFKIVKR